MADRLYVWAENTPVGRFDRNGDRVTFTYDDTYRTAVSLSLPREGGWVNKAPIRFLDNLLPDNPAVREIMAQTTHAVSTDTFDLLDGADKRNDLQRQANQLKAFAINLGVENPEVVEEVGSGMNDSRRKFNRLLADPTVGTIIVEHRDRLARMNAGLVESALKAADDA